MQAIDTLTIRELRDAVKRKELSFREIAEAFLGRIERFGSELRAFITVEPKAVLEEAEQLDRRLRNGDLSLGFLTGIPVALKDNLVTRGVRTTCGSRMLENYVPPYDATVVRRLKRDGALIVGKTNCDEFAMGSSTENSAFFPTRNPWDPERVSGGSSGGSAVAVAARLAPAALGSDTGGSIRQPAAFCGVVGLKPTYGRVSRYGLVAFASSFDQIGPFGNTVRDVATVLQVIAGHDPMDSTSADRHSGNYVAEIGKDVHSLRIGLPREWFAAEVDPEIARSVQAAVKELEKLGCEVREVSLPHAQFAIAAYYILAPAEASSNLARYDGVRYGFRDPSATELDSLYKLTRSNGFGQEVKRRIMLGTYVLSSGYYDAYFLKASRVRRLLIQDYQKAFQEVDFLVGPTTPTLPFRIGEKVEDPMEMYLMDIFTVTANLAGVPGLSLPCGVSESGLPIGIQIQAAHFQEGKILRLAHALEGELKLQRPLLTRF